jgi:uncharacterized DUF497 family protein
VQILKNIRCLFKKTRRRRDPMAAAGADPDHSVTEDRYTTFGLSERGRSLVVAHTEEEETIRIISAQPDVRKSCTPVNGT